MESQQFVRERVEWLYIFKKSGRLLYTRTGNIEDEERSHLFSGFISALISFSELMANTNAKTRLREIHFEGLVSFFINKVLKSSLL